ncbi:MAG: hypothetical protein ACKVW3_16850 [Phycisphaerales bacterium]
MLVELLRAGGTDLGRRWLAVLLMAPPEEREGIVAEAERRAIAAYAADEQVVSASEAAALLEPATEPAPGAEPLRFLVRHEPQQREGYVEHVEVEYKVRPQAKPVRLGKSVRADKAAEVAKERQAPEGHKTGRRKSRRA